MGKLVNFVTTLHSSTKRDYIQRMMNEKPKCMIEAKKYEKNYWDGDRKFGYGGYKYIPNRWRPVAKSLIDTYNLTDNSKLLDVGCGKGFLLHEIKKILPNIEVVGIEISEHAIKNSIPEIKNSIIKQKAQENFKFDDNHFDLVISIGCLHNLEIFDLKSSLEEIQRVSKKSYILVESFRNEEELFNLQCWALTCQSFFNSKEWIWLFNTFRYTGDYEFIYFE
jgi:ubiquinone/menaquinone biosynthesis C-methylase UbiE